MGRGSRAGRRLQEGRPCQATLGCVAHVQRVWRLREVHFCGRVASFTPATGGALIGSLSLGESRYYSYCGALTSSISLGVSLYSSYCGALTSSISLGVSLYSRRSLSLGQSLYCSTRGALRGSLSLGESLHSRSCGALTSSLF